MTPNVAIREARQRLGLSETDVAARAGLSPNEYLDLEAHENEAADVVHLSDLKKLVEVLHLDLLGLFGIGCVFCEHPELPTPDPHVTRNDLVRRTREAMGLSEDDLGDRVGFETVAIVAMESDPEFLESWSVGLVQELAAVLGLPLQVLLGVRCAACHR
jgi:transcriptional regulator with XRE-family HTH domain